MGPAQRSGLHSARVGVGCKTGSRPQRAAKDSPLRAHTRIFYRDEYVYDVVEAGPRYWYDTRKPRRVRDALVREGLVAPSDIVAAPPVSEEELLLVHTARYLRDIRQPERLAQLLMLDPERPWDERLLDPFLFAAGGTVAAARLAHAERAIAFNLGGGFHHAQPEKAEGFCAIADVAIAVRVLQRERQVSRVLIVDLDQHHGNGNALIFAADESVFTFSVHGGNWCWIEKRHNCDVELPSHAGDQVYLGAVRAHLPAIVRDFKPDFAFYLAGGDPFVEDTLGDFDVSEAGMLARDRYVTEVLWGGGIPMVVVTAGGYGAASWRIPFNYLRWLLGGGNLPENAHG